MAIPISKIVDYDLVNFKISLKEDFNLIKFLDENIGGPSSIRLDFDDVGMVANNLMLHMRDSV